MERTTNTSIIEYLLADTTYPVFFYEIELKDTGSGTFSNNILTDTDKDWVTNEWKVTTASLTDADGQDFAIDTTQNTTATSVTLLPGGLTPASGEYTLRRWYYLAQHTETFVASTGLLNAITFGQDAFGRDKTYLPYPISNQIVNDYELGKFPTLTVTLLNPGTEMISDYYDLSDFDFYQRFEDYNALRGCTVNIIITFIDSNGDLVSDSTIQLVNKFSVHQTNISNQQITFTLTSMGNLANKKIPSRSFTKATCSWIYKDTRCDYVHDPLLEGLGITDISNCNKQLRTPILRKMSHTLTHVSGDTFELEYDVTDTDVQTRLLGAIVEIPSANYLWRIIEVVSDSRIRIGSYSNLGAIQSNAYFSGYLDGNDQVIVNILEKECCIGHSATGIVSVNSKYYYEEDVDGVYRYRGNCRPNDFVYNGDFSRYITGSGPHEWDETVTEGSVSTSRPNSKYLIDASSGQLTLTQTVYNYSVETSLYPLEYGRWLDFTIRYYGSSASESAAYMLYSLLIEYNGSGSWLYWDASTSSFDTSVTNNSITLGDYDTRILFDIDEDTAFDEDTFNLLKFSTYHDHIKLNYALAGTYVSQIRLQITLDSSYVVLDGVSLTLRNQQERFGGFPGMPTNRFWYY